MRGIAEERRPRDKEAETAWLGRRFTDTYKTHSVGPAGIDRIREGTEEVTFRAVPGGLVLAKVSVQPDYHWQILGEDGEI